MRKLLVALAVVFGLTFGVVETASADHGTGRGNAAHACEGLAQAGPRIPGAVPVPVPVPVTGLPEAAPDCE